MLTRLKVSGFKNLVDVDVRFGPFTCIAGANGVGKSNLFDAIRFLSALADRPLMDAAISVRDENGRTADVRSIFHRVGDISAPEMSFEAEMIVPQTGQDDLGQEAKASITFLRYSVSLAYRSGNGVRPPGLELTKEELVHINRQDAHKNLLFPHTRKWRDSVIKGERRVPYFISTETDETTRAIVIKQHQDGGASGRPLTRLAANLPRTVLSAANASESPTASLARREMQSWRLLQLEPSAMRQPDAFTAPTRLGADGSHLAATLYHLAGASAARDADASQIHSRVANRLSELIEDVKQVYVDRDEKRELLALHITDRDGTTHAARALSDGTLRFMALVITELDLTTQGLLCLEEPENGIHPRRIPAMLRLLQDIATDANEPVGPDNSLRQVIINTHSPLMVKQVCEDDLLIAELRETEKDGRYFKRVAFSSLAKTWRTKLDGGNVVAFGTLLAYLNPDPKSDAAGTELDEAPDYVPPAKLRSIKPRRVMDRDDLQELLPLNYN